LELQGNASANRLEINDRSGEFVRQESPRYAASLGGEYKLANQKTSLGGNLSWNSSFSREASTNTLVNVGNNHQLDVYAVYRLDATANLRLSVSNLTAPNRTIVSERYANGALDTRETSTTKGVRMVMLTLEKKW
jgi:iron complex outermembrane receptor protein